MLILIAFIAQIQAQSLAPIFVNEMKSEVELNDLNSFIKSQDTQAYSQATENFILKELDNESSLHTARNGAYSGVTTSTLRGLPGQYTTTYFDNVKINDPSAVTRIADPSFLNKNDFDGYEFIKGPQSVLYGSDAVGGVIRLKSVSPKKNGQEMNYGIGSFGTANIGSQISEINGSTGTLFRMNYFKTDGISSVASKTNAEKDGLVTGNIFLKNQSQVGKGRNEFTMNIAGSEFDQDGFTWGVGPVDELDRLGRKDEYLFSNTYSQGDFQLNTSIYQVFRRDESPTETRDFRGENKTIEAIVNTTSGDIKVTSGAEVQVEGAKDSLINEEAFSTSVYSQAWIPLDDQWISEVGARGVHNEYFGFDTAVSVSQSYYMNDAHKFVFRAAQGFKNPDLYQTKSQWGDSSLTPERSSALELGAEVSPSDRVEARVIAFRQQINDFIDFDMGTQKYFQSATRIKAQGLEVEAVIKPSLFQRVSFGYTFTDSKTVSDTIVPTQKVPKHKLSLSYQREFNDELSLFARVKHVATTFDQGQKLGSYFLLDLGSRHRLNSNTDISFSVENLFDKDYQTAWGYNSLPFNIMTQVSTRF
jgi:vitamin B12 transporter